MINRRDWNVIHVFCFYFDESTPSESAGISFSIVLRSIVVTSVDHAHNSIAKPTPTLTPTLQMQNPDRVIQNYRIRISPRPKYFRKSSNDNFFTKLMGNSLLLLSS